MYVDWTRKPMIRNLTMQNAPFTPTVKFTEEYLGETPAIRDASLQELHTWSTQNPQLHISPDELSLVAFLRGAKFDMAKAQQKLKRYSKMRRDLPEWFQNRTVGGSFETMEELIRLRCFLPLRTTFDGQLVVIIRTAAHDPHRHRQDDVFKADLMMLDVAAREMEAAAQIYGVTAIFDMAGATLAHAKQMSPSVIRKAVYSWQNYHCKPKRLEFVNGPFAMNCVLSVFRSFMSAKLLGRMRVHFKGADSLTKHIPRDVLPQEYGGTGEGLEETTEYWLQKFRQYKHWFHEDEQYRAD